VVLAKIQDMDIDEASEWMTVKSDVRSVLGRFLYERTGRRPMIIPVVMEV